MKLLPIAIVYTILGTAAVVLGFYQYLFVKPSPYLGPFSAGYGLWFFTFFGFPLIALGITLLLLDEGESLLVSILAVIGSLSLSVAIHQVLIYPIIQSAPLLFMGTASVVAFIALGVLLLATSIFAHFKTRNPRVKRSQNASGDRMT